MTARKPLADGCTGDASCQVPGHVVLRGGGHHRVALGHIDLTAGQRRTLAERSAEPAPAPLVGREICRARGSHRSSGGSLSGLFFCADCDYVEGD